MPMKQIPKLSIIVPVLNEGAELPHLLAMLASQEGGFFELILCDGGSSDGTCRLASELAPNCPFPLQLTTAPRGRACQMNAGAAVARGDILLFLHADSGFSEQDALCKAFATFTENRRENGNIIHAGHCGLRFSRTDTGASLAYFYYEAKSRLDRDDCIRGDQGLMLARAVFNLLGGFDEALTFLEDIRFARLLATRGRWMLLPVEITTSARRFEIEGLYERQVVNAIIANCAAIGCEEFFKALPGLYSCHTETGRLQLFPLFDGIRAMLDRHTGGWRRSFWRATGQYVAGNAWQLFFWMDVRQAFRAGKGPEDVESRCLEFYQKRWAPFLQSRSAGRLAQLAVRVWFWWMLRATQSRPEVALTKTS